MSVNRAFRFVVLTLVIALLLGAMPVFAPQIAQSAKADTAAAINTALSKAAAMCSIQWSPTVTFHTWQAGKDGSYNSVEDINGNKTKDASGKNSFVVGHTYRGIPYTMNNTETYDGYNHNRLDEIQWTNYLKTYSNASSYFHNLGGKRDSSCSIGVDCSGLVQRALQAAGCSGVSGLNTAGLKNGSFNTVFKKLSNFNDLRPGDVLSVNNDSIAHMVLIGKVVGNDVYIYESNATFSKCTYRSRSLTTYRNEGYSAYRYRSWDSVNPNPNPDPDPDPNPDPDPDPTVVTNDYIVHIDHPSGSYNGANGVEISGWVASKIKLNSVMAQSTAIVGGQMNLTSGATDASDELNAAGYTDFAYKYRFRGVIPPDGLTANTTYSFSVWMDLATGGQTKVTTSTFHVDSLGGGGGTVPTPTDDDGYEEELYDCIVHIDAPTGTYTDTDVEISGWIASMKPVGSCMVESEAIPLRQENLTGTLTDASAELNGAGYGAYPYKYRFRGAIPKYGMASNTDYDLKVWFNFTDGSSSGVTSTTFHTAEMKNTKIVITKPTGGYNFPNNYDHIKVEGYILSNSKLWYILGQVGDRQFSLNGTSDATLAKNNGYEYAHRFSYLIPGASLPDNSNPTLEIWTKTAADGVETHKQVSFTVGAKVYGNINDYQSVLDRPTEGQSVTGTNDFEVTGWIAAHAPITAVFFQAVPTDGSGGIQKLMGLEGTSELDSGYSGYQYRFRYRGVVAVGELKSNKTYEITVWANLVNSNGSGEQKFLAGCGRKFTTGNLSTPVYTNTFNANGGTGAPAAIKKTWNVATYLPTDVPTRLGYTFMGWTFDSNAYEAKYIPGQKFTEETSHTLYAVWEKANLIEVDTTKLVKTVDVRFGNQKVAYSLMPAESTRYRFKADGGILTVYDSSGTVLGSGSQVDVDLTASENYYISAGYESATAKGSFDITVLQGYPVSFDANGGEGAPEGVLYQFYDEALTLPTDVPTYETEFTLDANGGSVTEHTVRYAAAFQGWAMKDEIFDSGAAVMPNEASTLSAVWEYPAVGHLETPVREGYELRYWMDDSLQSVGADYIAVNDETLHAIWVLKQYDIAYDLNGGEGAIDLVNKLHGFDITITDIVPVREGFEFLGWAGDPAATEPDYTGGDVYSANSNKTLYAVWKNARVPVETFALTEQTFTVRIGGTHALTAVITPEEATDKSVSWTSLKESVATVDENGVVTGISVGTAMIKAVCNDNGAVVYSRATVEARSEVVLPKALTQIEPQAFMGDTSIEIVRIDDNVTRIGSKAFAGCVNLEEIYIPDSVKHIELDAFDGCENLTIHCVAESEAWEVALLNGISYILD